MLFTFSNKLFIHKAISNERLCSKINWGIGAVIMLSVDQTGSSELHFGLIYSSGKMFLFLNVFDLAFVYKLCKADTSGKNYLRIYWYWNKLCLMESPQK